MALTLDDAISPYDNWLGTLCLISSSSRRPMKSGRTEGQACGRRAAISGAFKPPEPEWTRGRDRAAAGLPFAPNVRLESPTDFMSGWKARPTSCQAGKPDRLHVRLESPTYFMS